MADDADLREAARARGFRLMKSRRRKAGGDFGRYGLVDSKGRECMGFGPDGYTASADEVLAYLRGGEAASWKRSLIGVVGREPEPKPPKKKKPAPARPATEERKPAHKVSPPPVRAKAPKEAPPELAVREATRRDAAALAKLLDLPSSAFAERLAAAIKAGEPPLVADRDGAVGVAAWTILPTLQSGPRGRITLLFVDEEERRRGTGTALLREAEQRLEEAGVTSIEMALDIEFDAPAGFLRSTGWRRTTNGYGKELGTS